MDGNAVGLVGWLEDGDQAQVFMKITDALRKHPRFIFEQTTKIMADLPSPALCIADLSVPGACRFLEKFGWQHKATIELGEVYEWTR